MRNVLATLPILALAACGGAGPQSVGSIAPLTGAVTGTTPATGGTGGAGTTGTTGGSTGSTVSGGSGAGVTSGGSGSGTTTTVTSFLTANAAKSYSAVGGSSSLNQDPNGTLYQGNAATVKAPSGTIDYDPRDGIFTVKIADTKAGVSTNLRYQDPLHQTAFGGSREPQSGVPNLGGFSYLESVGAATTDRSTFFYQRPGAATVYVTLAGYVRNSIPVDPAAAQTLERGAFAFGDQTPLSQLPATGTVSYTGGFLAGMIANPTRDTAVPLPTYYQWIAGSSSVNGDFGRQSFALALDGSVDSAGATGVLFATGTRFFANGSGTIDLLRTGGLSGAFQNACFVAACGSAGSDAVAFNGVTAGSSVTGASSIDAAFYGPGGVNVGGSFRVIGGVPDQRVDITGAFTGAKIGN